jgi:predicted metalloprotease with PDZ domain
VTWKTFIVIASLTTAATCRAESLPTPRDVPFAGPIVLSVDATDVEHRVLRIRETIPVRAGPLTLLYPEWIPGTHAPTNEIKRLAGLRIVAGQAALAWTRDPANMYAFHIDVPNGVRSIELEFQQLLSPDGGGYSPLVSRGHFELQWQGTVLAPAGYYASRIEVDPTLRLPAGFEHATALRPIAGASNEALHFQRVSLENLVDSPVFAGKHVKRYELDPGNARPVVFHVFADDPAWLDIKDEQVELHRNLVTQADRLFGARHFAHYELMLALSDDHPFGGLEHHQSSENATKGAYFTEWDKSSGVRDLLPHEFTHSWNGKFRRPRDLWAPDFNVPERNSLLWVYEGQTEYWGQVLAARSGLVKAEEMREWFAWTAAVFQTRPGRSWRSLQDTVHDEVIAGRQRGLDWVSWQRFEDYYDESLLIWLDVDTRIRERSHGARSLDDFARAFFGVQDGRIAPLLYDFDDVVATLERVEADDWAKFLRVRLDSLDRSPLEGLERSGWRLAWTDKQSDYVKNQESVNEFAGFTYSLGFSTGKEGKVQNIVWDGPAFKAGMGAGLTLLAVNLHEYKPDVLRKALDAAKSDAAPIELLLKDGNEYRVARIDYHGGQRYPVLERIDGTPDLLSRIFAPR